MLKQIWESTNWFSIAGLLAIGLGSVLSLVGGMLSGNKSQKELTDRIDEYQREIREKDKRLEELKATNGRLITRGKMNMSKDFIIRIGSNILPISAKTLQTTQVIQPLKRGYDIDLSFTLRIKEGVVVVSFDLRNIRGDIVGRMSDNVWFLSPGIFDRNYDKDAVEIIDIDGITKFQLDASNPQEYQISGVFVSGDLLIAISPNGKVEINSIHDKPKHRLSQISGSVPNVFEYPSISNLGVRAKR